MNSQINRKKILISPLNWGLGHASRCIVVIKEVISQGFEVLIASDGAAGMFLKKQFPELLHLELPNYNLKYSRLGCFNKAYLMTQIPHIQKCINKETELVAQWVDQYQIDGIISDNRLGVYSNKIPSVYITHQTVVKSGWTTFLTTAVHQKMLAKFDACWIPDFPQTNSMAGALSKPLKTPHKYLGNLSSLSAVNQEQPPPNDLLILLSGLEPQRSILEEKIRVELNDYQGKVVLVQGKMSEKQTTTVKDNITMVNYLKASEVEQLILESKNIICRSGYSTLMDLNKLNKTGFLIPTPGQAEQEYLAAYYRDKKYMPSCTQESFKLKMIEEIPSYTGFPQSLYACDWRELLSLF
ncbi:MAG: glycosyltransferase [Flavobacterium sp.]|nr:glycosyltransferase [Candidatus Neoflavobacterium equi]